MTLCARDRLALTHANAPMEFSVVQEVRNGMIFMMVGLPGSGKSSVAKKLQKETGAIIISKDIIRYGMLGKEYDPETEPMVHSMFRGLYVEAIVYEKDIILDATHLTKGPRNEFINVAKAYRARIMAIVVKCAFEQAWARKQATGTDMPWSVFFDKTREYQTPSMDEGFYKIIEIDNNGPETDEPVLVGKGGRAVLKSSV